MSSCEETRPIQQWDISNLCSVAELLESKLGHEISLLGHRMESLAISETFLFGAFSLILTSGGRIPPTAKFVMLVSLPIVGVALAVVSLVSLKAALAVAEALREARGDIDGCIQRLTGLGARWPNLGNAAHRNPGLKWTLDWGSAATKFVPLMLAVWMALIVVLVVVYLR